MIGSASTQSKSLRVLIVEDSEAFVSFLVSCLEHAGYKPSFERVDKGPTMSAALDQKNWDLILSDYMMPGFDGMAALRLCKEKAPDLPFILVSGSVGEDLAVAAMHAGADDYILKNNTTRLLPAIERALRESVNRRERRRAEEALRTSEAYASMIVDSSLDMIIAVNVERRITQFNRAAEAVFGYSAAEILGKDVKLLYADPQQSQVVHLAVLNTGRWVREICNKRKNGEVFPSFLSASIMRDVQGNVVGYMGISRDITEQKQRNQELTQSLSRLQAILESSADGVLVTDLSGTVTNYNRRLLELWGMSASALGLPLKLRLEGMRDQLKDGPGFLAKINALHAHPEAVDVAILEFKDGRVFERYSHPQEIDGRSVGRVWVFRDVSERRRLEEQTRQLQKMETIGAFAEGIAHDFNNILTLIQGRASLLLAQRNLAAEVGKAVREMSQAAELGASLTNRLLMFGRRKSMKPEVLDLNQVVDTTAQMLRRILGEQTALRVQCGLALPPIWGNADLLEQVLLNLAVNARDAMPQGGELLIVTQVVLIDGTQSIQNPEARPGLFVRLDVSDTGCGIAPENSARVFEPFFTTKEIGKGTGLGLATVYGIVKQHEGWIEVASEVGRGTTFRIFLPSEGTNAKPARSAPEKERIRGGAEKILVVEDEAAVRELVKGMLEHLGYTVLMASSGVEALEAWARHRQDIDLLLTDMVMPKGMTGPELAERMWAENPKLKVVFTSGYNAQAFKGGVALQEGINFVRKPFSIQKVARAVRDCLDGNPARPERGAGGRIVGLDPGGS